MLKVELKSARARVRTRFWGEGSVRAETVDTSCLGVETSLELESEADPALVAKLARVAEQGCYVLQSLKRPTPTEYRVTLNGAALDVSAEADALG